MRERDEKEKVAACESRKNLLHYKEIKILSRHFLFRILQHTKETEKKRREIKNGIVESATSNDRIAFMFF